MVVKYKNLAPWPTPMPKAGPEPGPANQVKPEKPLDTGIKPSNPNDPVKGRGARYEIVPSYDIFN
jgi:hypothetical protein